MGTQKNRYINFANYAKRLHLKEASTFHLGMQAERSISCTFEISILASFNLSRALNALTELSSKNFEETSLYNTALEKNTLYNALSSVFPSFLEKMYVLCDDEGILFFASSSSFERSF